MNCSDYKQIKKNVVIRRYLTIIKQSCDKMPPVCYNVKTRVFHVPEWCVTEDGTGHSDR